jgi:hypothetical protein
MLEVIGRDFMSVAGVRSNRGDVYQTLIALGWVVQLILDADVQSIEVDATASTGAASPPVDDVVVTYNDGRKICCQCKKNETDFKLWSVASLKDELLKAAHQLADNPTTLVRFYSRSPFGELAKLREAAQLQRDYASFVASLTSEHAATVGALRQAWATAQFRAGFEYEFLRRVDFITTGPYEDLEKEQVQTLARVATSAPTVYEALWNAVDKAGARVKTTTSAAATETGILTREDIQGILRSSGSTLAPPADQTELASRLKALSQVGRFWHRSIGNARLERSATATLADALHLGTRSVLLTGGPGSGKSCVLLDLADQIERGGTAFCVYVQGRAFAAAQSAAEREVRGLPADFVSNIARMAEFQPVVVVLDSLDVLSLGREHGALAFFLALMDQILAVNGVAVVAAARSFDAKYDSNLATRAWGLKHHLADLNWDTEVKPLLVAWNVDEGTLAPELRALLLNPRHLALFHDIQARGTIPAARSHHELTRSYLDVCIRGECSMGAAAIDALGDIANQMLRTRALEITRERARLAPAMEIALCSAGALQRTDRGNLEFTHQTLLDVLAISAWERQRGTLTTFIDALPNVPFVRPAIRTYVLHLGAVDRRTLRAQLRSLVASQLPHHVRRLLVETFAELVPDDDDWPFVNSIRPHTSLFEAMFVRGNTLAWQRFWMRHLAPIAFAEHLGSYLLMLTHKVAEILMQDIGAVLEFWIRVMQQDWLDRDRAATTIGFALSEHLRGPHPAAEALARALLDHGQHEYDSIGAALMRGVEVGAISDELLWKYIAGAVDENALHSYTFESKLHCEQHVFGEGGRLATRMEMSDRLLELAIETITRWTQVMEQRYQPEGPWHENFLIYTTWRLKHSRHDTDHATPVHVLFQAIERGVLARCGANSAWWRANANCLAASRDGAQRYWCVTGITRQPAANIALAAELACQEQMLTSSLSHEVGDMINAVSPLLDEAQQIATAQAISAIAVRGGRLSAYDRYGRAMMIKAIPAPYRPSALQSELEDVERKYGIVFRLPDIRSAGGRVRAPFNFERFLEASDDDVIRLLDHYTGDADSLRSWGEMIGGPDEVGLQLREASSRAPKRFLGLLRARFADIPEQFRPQLLGGARQWTEHRAGALQQQPGWSPVEEVDPAQIAGLMLDELERHPAAWAGKSDAAAALHACALALAPSESHRLAFQLFGFLQAPPPSSLSDLIITGINSIRGNAGEAAIIMATRCTEAVQPIADILRSVLTLFADDPHPAVRSVILRRLPYFISRSPDLGWALFYKCIADETPALWAIAEPCLYYAYAKDFERVEPILHRMFSAEDDNDCRDRKADPDDDPHALMAWARISALSSLAGHIPYSTLVQRLQERGSAHAWKGAIAVWSANAHLVQHQEACFAGLRLALGIAAASANAAQAMDRVFRNDARTAVPLDLIGLMFQVLRRNEDRSQFYHPHQFAAWLDAIAGGRPDDAVAALELLVQFVADANLRLHDSGTIARVLTTLFREAEEREPADEGALLRRMVAAQDTLLSNGMRGLEDWLRDVERP